MYVVIWKRLFVNGINIFSILIIVHAKLCIVHNASIFRTFSNWFNQQWMFLVVVWRSKSRISPLDIQKKIVAYLTTGCPIPICLHFYSCLFNVYQKMLLLSNTFLLCQNAHVNSFLVLWPFLFPKNGLGHPVFLLKVYTVWRKESESMYK